MGYYLSMVPKNVPQNESVSTAFVAVRTVRRKLNKPNGKLSVTAEKKSIFFLSL